MSENSIEKEIQNKGKTAPRVTPEHVDSLIVQENYLEKIYGVLTICVLKLQNGFIVTGESACASPENYDQEIGHKIARENARDKIWALEGYLLRQKLYDKE